MSVSVVAALTVVSAARPHYGGTLRVEMTSTIAFAPQAAPAADAVDAAPRLRALPLVFETLTRVEFPEGLAPALATAWDSDDRGARWRFHVRRGVALHDGTPLELWQIATALRAVEPQWKIAADGDVVAIEPDQPRKDLPWLVAEERYAIAVRSSSGAQLGSGPFRVDRADGSRVTLKAHDGYRDGRPFVDAVEMSMGRPLAAQLADLEARRADVVAVQPTDGRRLADRGLKLTASEPLELIALVVEPHRSGVADEPARQTMAAAINRSAMCTVLLQQQAAPADGLLPARVSGYPSFPTIDRRPLTRAAALALAPERRDWAVRVDPADPLALAIAERLAVDGREAGLNIRVQPPSGLSPRPDARLVRIRVRPTTPGRALSEALQRFAARSNVPRVELAPMAPTETVYREERRVLDSATVIPLVFLREVYGVAERVATNAPLVRGNGVWNFADAWFRSAQ